MRERDSSLLKRCSPIVLAFSQSEKPRGRSLRERADCTPGFRQEINAKLELMFRIGAVAFDDLEKLTSSSGIRSFINTFCLFFGTKQFDAARTFAADPTRS